MRIKKSVRVAVISHQQLKERFKYLKNFDATIAFFRRPKIKLLPPSIRKGNISSLKRGNIGLHPEVAVELLEEIFKLRKQGKSYKEIKGELKEDIAYVRAWYTLKGISANDPRARPDELLNTYNAVLPALEEYYKWDKESRFSSFYRSIPDELMKWKDLYFNIVMKLGIKGNPEEEAELLKNKELLKSQEEYGKKLDACFDTIYFIIHQYEKLRKQHKKLIPIKLDTKEL